MNGVYTLPRDAKAKAFYRCPKCMRDVFLRKRILKPTKFEHVDETSCDHFSFPDKKELAKQIILNALRKRKIKEIIWSCNKCENANFRIGEPTPIRYDDNDMISLGENSDIIITNNGVVKYTFIISHGHNINLFRPEPWFEFNVEDVLDDHKHLTAAVCIRSHICRHCVKKISYF